MIHEGELRVSLQQSKLFSFLSLSEIDLFLSLSKKIKLSKNSFLLREGDHGDDFFWIYTGSLSISLSSQKRGLRKLKSLTTGDVVGEMILLGKNTRTASVQAESDSELLSWNCGECFRFFEKQPLIAYVLMKNLSLILSDRIESMNQKLKISEDKIDIKIFEALMAL